MEKKKLYGEDLKAQLEASRRDKLYPFLMGEDTIRGVAVNGTRMVNEMRWNHELGLLETLVLGHGYLAAALISATLKGNDRIAIDVGCSGPIKGMSVEANAFGEVRGFLKQVPIPIDKPLESFDLRPFYGAGFLSVTKYLQDAKHPFTGKVMMAYGSLAKDLSHYYLKSEQLPSAFSLGIFFDGEGNVQGAGGLMLQALPGAPESLLARLEALVHDLPSMGQAVGAADFPEPWLAEAFPGLGPRILDRRGVEFMCHCNREKIGTMLAMLDPAELADMARNGPFPVEIRCHNCNTLYAFDRKDLAEIRAAAKK
ncbi:Hsp33 family molecular chaperone HslO [Desulfatitalea alkaliphila]|uniref:Hsp33 family molecular chaperone HslO n=1 Tax=Desulfatitalea alkaliphila TaxID=2929485 RepID=A0AA41R528_9BACT|nr:Hsp33 family molecular chaperone HslO [Desulfatitalea alkaliphila]MCJ8501110.1 Hsp33 family molecular chaperone HslO [Desulfatitalea alkaliphila]